MRIMVIDDSATIRRLEKSVLTQLGYSDIVEAVDGIDAISKVNATPPDLVLLDWNMPNLDGLGFLKKFRTMYTKTPVIMVTTEAEKVRVVEAIKAGVTNYLIKPFTTELLKSRINETLERKAG